MVPEVDNLVFYEFANFNSNDQMLIYNNQFMDKLASFLHSPTRLSLNTFFLEIIHKSRQLSGIESEPGDCF